MRPFTRWRPGEALGWSPFREMEEWWRRNVERFTGEGGAMAEWMPCADLVETPEAYVLKLEAPGMRAEQIQITLSGDALTLKGEKPNDEKREQDTWHTIERRTGRFQRTFRLPGPVHADAVEASMQDGLLCVRLPKVTESRTVHVEVKG